MAVPASQLITDLANRMGLNPGVVGDGSRERVDLLRQLNISQKEICQEHSLRFLISFGTLNIVNSSVAVPSTIDDSKTMTLGRPSGDGEITYVEVDRWFLEGVDDYLATVQTAPTHYTIAGATFLFKPAGLTVAVPYLAQLRVTDMTDAVNSFSVLPPTWEDTLLLIDAEYELRRVNNEPQTAELKTRATAKREALYGSYRTSKIQAKTDREQQERKTEKSMLSDEAADLQPPRRRR